ncbi:MAG: hypothetical protein ACQEVA_21890 [Myxococcota bacterium]
MLEFDQCQTADDCGRIDQCVEGVCQEPNYVEVSDFIVEDTTWTSDNIYVLKNVVMVIQPSTLTIEPGTTILGERDTALVTQAGARLEAEGTREQPIVFTSAKPVGQRRAGDWGGLALIGKARINRPDMALNIITNREDALIGGQDDAWNCGTLKYVRSEFGGGIIDGEKALNGLTLAGCGSETTVDYVQAHLGDDDGIELFGGTVDIRHAVASRPQGDGFDLDVGWRGTGQFLAVQMDVNGEEAIEMENRGEEPSATPQTDFDIYNFTVIGSEQAADVQRGAIFKSGGLGRLSHGIMMGTTTDGVHIEGIESAEHGVNGDLNIENTLFFDVGSDEQSYFTLDEDAQASSFDPKNYFRQDEFNNLIGADPGLTSPYDLGNPGWQPSAENTTGIEPPPEPFDPTAVYRGAFSPSSPPWTEGWTAYPKN